MSCTLWCFHSWFGDSFPFQFKPLTKLSNFQIALCADRHPSTGLRQLSCLRMSPSRGAHFTLITFHWRFQSMIMWSQKYERPRFQMVMVCYGVMDPPDPPYILILMASLQGIAFNMLWVGADYHHNDELFRLNLSRARALRSEICSCLILAAQPSGIAYMTSVAPQALTGTAISLMATVTWVVGKGVKSCW